MTPAAPALDMERLEAAVGAEPPGAAPEPPLSAAEAARAPLTLRGPQDIVAMTFDDSDIILGDRLLADGQPGVIAGAGGTGKSRLILQLAACTTTGRQFLNFATGGHERRWLFLQTENSNRRLQADLGRLRSWLGDDWAEFCEKVVIHTIETDTDGFVSLDSLENVAAIERAIGEARPEIIVVDPLSDFAIGDLNKDTDMRLTLQTLSRICRRGNPQRVPLVIHHALTGRAGAARATGYDRASFGRNSKVLHAWTRGQLNLAALDADNNEGLVVSCGKCSNGREFQSFAIRLNPETFIYECDPTVDIKGWETAMAGKDEPLMTPARVGQLCRLPMTKVELSKAIIQDCGCARGTAYKYITKAERARHISFSHARELYTAK